MLSNYSLIFDRQICSGFANSQFINVHFVEDVGGDEFLFLHGCHHSY